MRIEIFDDTVKIYGDHFSYSIDENMDKCQLNIDDKYKDNGRYLEMICDEVAGKLLHIKDTLKDDCDKDR